MTVTTQLPLAKEAVLVRAWRVTHELTETGELILFDESASEVVMFNQIGASVWELIDGERSVEDIVNFIVAARARSEEHAQIERDVAAFLAQLLERQSIQLRG